MDTKFCECWRSKGPGGEQGGRGPGVLEELCGAGSTPWAKGPGKQRFGNARTEGRERALVGNEEQLDGSWEACMFSINVIWLKSK